MQWLLILPALVLAVWLILRWLIRAEPRQILRVLRGIGWTAGALIVIYATLTGRLPVLLGIAAFLIPLITRWRALQNMLKTARGPTPGQGSEVRTRFVLMRLDHDTGEMDGTVVEGRFAGRELSSLTFVNILEILEAARIADQQSAQVLQAYLERMHGEAWQAHMAGSGAGSHRDAGAPAGGPMSAKEARAILGVGVDAGPEAIKQAHRRLMKQVHPDHGGSDYLAARINEAKEVLLKE